MFDGMNQSPFREQIKKINDSMAIAAPPKLDSVNGSHVPLPLGPPIGSERNRSDEWLDRCISKDVLSRVTFSMPGAKESLEYRQFRARVASAMSCSSCHNGRESPPLGFSKKFVGSLSNLLKFNAMFNDMPRMHKFDLSRTERSALRACLTYEYFEEREIGEPGEFQQWLFGRSCTDRRALGLEPSLGGSDPVNRIGSGE